MTRVLFVACLFIGLLAGCSREVAPTRIVDARAPALDARMTGGVLKEQPLASGDHWTYDKHLRSFSVSSGDTTVLLDIYGTVDVTVDCPDTSAGRAYLFQTSLEIQHLGNISTTSTSWINLRQDSKGLYALSLPPEAIPDCTPPGALSSRDADPAADAIVAAASARLPPGLSDDEARQRLAAISSLAHDEVARPGRPAPGAVESQLLAYPLHPGQRWISGIGLALYDARVSGFGSMTVPAGTWPSTQVTSVRNNGFSAYRDDAWYGPVGLIREHRHVESEVDVGGGSKTVLVSESEMVLKSVHLVDDLR